VNGHIKAVSRPRMAVFGNNPPDVLVLKEFLVNLLVAFNGLITRKNTTST
jgi:hypothetical protein